MSNDSQHKYPWDEWQLTAFALDELEPELSAQIESAALQDEQLAAEIADIRATLTQVRDIYAADAQASIPAVVSLGTHGLANILRQAEGNAASASQSSAAGSSRAAASRKTAWFGLLAMAASLMVALWFSAPAVTNWMVVSKESASKEVASNASAAELRNAELSKQLDDLKRELAETSTATGIRSALPDALTDTVHERNPEIVEGSQAGAERVRDTIDEMKAADSSSEIAKNFNAARDALELRDQEFADAMRTAETASVPSDNVPVTYADAKQWEELLARRKRQYGEAKLSEHQSPELSDSLAAGLESSGGYPASEPAAETLAGGMMGGMPRMESMASGMGAPSGYEMSGGMNGMEGYGSMMGGTMGGSGGGMGMGETFTFEGRRPNRGQMGEAILTPDGSLPESNTNRFDSILENKFERVDDEPLSTFSIDVDTASYAKSRQLLMEAHRRPPAGAVRIEEFINYFDYEYAGPKVTGTNEDEPFAAHLAVASCPWRPEHQLVRIALQARKVDLAKRPHANIVFLLDVSGSMDEPNKLPLVKESMRMLIEQLGENDKVAMVVYAGAAGCVLESTRGDKQQEILGALERLSAGGSTNGGAGIQLAYKLARDNYIPEGINRVILCTDGDFNVGVTSTESLVDLVVENAKSRTFLTVLGFGMGNTNDAMMEQISNRGNGVYGFVDSWREAKRQMVQQLAGNLITVAKDVKIQVEFNPTQVKSYRLLGYENRVMAAADFNNDKKDAGEIGAGHRMTALYEIVPVGSESDADRPVVDDLRYQKKASKPTESETVAVLEEVTEDKAALVNELLAVKLRYKQPEGDTSKLLVFPLEASSNRFVDSDQDFRWAASVAEFGMLLRGSRHVGNASWSGLIEQATAAAGVRPDPQREECLQMMRQAAQLR
jgi:Ca-activated chloride channel homolog